VNWKIHWQKMAVWAGAVIVLFLLLIISTAYLIQRNTSLHRYLLAKMIQIGESSTGARIAIRDYAVRWLPLRITLREVVVHGTEKDSARPLASVAEVEVGIAWGALLHKRFDLTELILDRPAINFLIDEAGRSNLPAQPVSQAPSAGKLQVSVRHATVRNGELRYNDLPRKIDADLADFHLVADQVGSEDQYSGTLGYSKGVIVIDGYAPVRHDIQLSFAATRSGITFESIHVATGSSQLNAKGIVRGYRNPVVEAQYQALLSTADLHDTWRAAPLSGGEIDLAGSLSYSGVAGPPLDSLKVAGQVSSRMLNGSWSGTEVTFRSLAGEYLLENGNLHVGHLQADTMGGVLRAEFSAERLTATPRYQLSLSAESLSLGEAQQLAGAKVADTKIAPMRGTARVHADAQWAASLPSLIAHADASISALISSSQDSSSGRYSAASKNSAWLPLDAELHIAYDAPRATLTVTNSSLSSNQTRIVADGTISNHSALALRARTSDLREVDLLVLLAQGLMNSPAKAGSASTSSSVSHPLDLHGMASLEAQVQGRIQDPRITGHARADALEIRKTRWPHVQADFNLTASSASLQNGHAQSLSQGRLDFALQTALQHWSYAAANNPVTLQVQASQLPLSDLEQLTGFSAPASGMLSGNLSLRGTIDDAAGDGALQLSNASLWGEPVRSVTAQLHGADKTLSASFSIAAEAGNIGGQGSFSASDRRYQILIRHSVLNLGQIHGLSSRGYRIAGRLGIDVQGQGTLQAPQFDIALAGEQLVFRDEPLGSINAQVHAANQQANFTLTSNISGGQIQANGNFGFASPYIAYGAFEIRSLQFGPLLATYLPAARRQLQANAEVRGQIDGPLARPEEIKASVELSTLNMAYQDLNLASAGPVRLNYADNLLTISQAEVKGNGTDFKFAGTLPLRNSAPMNVSATGSIDLKLLSMLGSDTQSSGTVNVNVTAKGTFEQPQLGGTIEVAGAAFTSDVTPIGVDKLNARLAVTNSRLTIESLSGQMSGGTFSASGFASYSPPSFSLQVNGKSVRVRYPQGTRAQVDADLTLIGNPAAAALNGRVTLDTLSFTPDFDLANFIGQFSSSSPSVPSPWEQNTRLNVAVASSDVLALSSSKLSLQGSADLRVAGTLANPVVLGRTTLSGGELFFMGNLYQVQSGTVVFSNPVRTTPTLNLYVTTVVEQYNLTLNFVGPLDLLRTNYTSDPALPPVDIINLLAFGKTTGESAATSTPATLGAEGVIANGLTGQVSSRIEKLAGISQLQIDPSLGGDNSNPGARVAIQQRLTSNILFTFATDLTNTQNETAQLKYQTKGRLALSLTRDEYGSFAIEAKIRKKF
jgi:translocation and assembly module TamB